MLSPFIGRIPNLKGKLIPVEWKQWFVEELKRNPDKLNDFVQRTKLSRKTFWKWKRNVEVGIGLRETVGRPVAIDSEESASVQKTLINAIESSDAILLNEANSLIVKAAQNTVAKVEKFRTKPIKERTIRKYKALLIEGRNSQIKPNARMVAEVDVKNCLSQIIMWYSVLKILKYDVSKIINYDATQFEVGERSKVAKVAVPKGWKRPRNVALNTGAKTKSKDLTFFIKWYCLVCASGKVNPTNVFVVADPLLGEKEFHFVKIPGLSNNTAVMGSFGYLCFCNSRSGNEAFYEWLNVTVLIDFVNLVREDGSLAVDDYVFVNCDGEHVQIMPYMNPNIRTKLRDLNVIVGKISASCTAVAQALDAYALFKSLKTRLRAIIDGKRRTKQLGLTNNIRVGIENYEQTVKHLMNSSDKRRLIDGLLDVMQAISDEVRSDTIISSFDVIGITNDGVLNIQQMLDQFKVKVTESEFNDIVNQLPVASKIYNANGTISDAELDMFVVVNRLSQPANGLPKDKLVLSRQRAVIVNHDEVYQRYLDVIAARQKEEEDAVVRKAERQKKIAENKSNAEAKKSAAAEKKRKREEDSAAKVKNKFAKSA